MLTRRIAVGATALTLALPALAGASPIHDPSTAQRAPVAYGGPAVAGGDTKSDLPNTQNLGVPARVDRIGSLTAAQLAAAYGTTQPVDKPVPAVTASNNDGTDGWELAALGGAALLAACGLGGTLLVRARRRTAVGA
ncbi:MAG TPA: hypothetical protein VH834_17340 [Solirubrobacteraceae bacterium]|jgi:hypothetical protein